MWRAHVVGGSRVCSDRAGAVQGGAGRCRAVRSTAWGAELEHRRVREADSGFPSEHVSQKVLPGCS